MANLSFRLAALRVALARNDSDVVLAQGEALLSDPEAPPVAVTAARRALAPLYLERQRPADAVRMLRPLIAAGPTDTQVWRWLGRALYALNRNTEAETALRRALDMAPAQAELWMELANVLIAEARPGEAAAAFHTAAEAAPDSPTPWSRLGFLRFNSGRLDDAEAAFGRALSCEAGHPSAVAGLAMVAERRGDLHTARQLATPLAHRNPPHPLIAASLATTCLRQGKPLDALPIVEQALTAPPTQEDRRLLLHARADLLDALDRIDEAFAAYQDANRAGAWSFDLSALLAVFEEVKRNYGPEVFARPPLVARDALPILIVGMPRSGTSLVEQILASHPAVTAGGELEDWRLIAKQAHGRDLHAPRLNRIATRYLNRLRAIAEPGTRRVTDKMPSNVLHLGLVALACPGAHIIHCVRDPRDVGWSCYRMRFTRGLAYTTDLAAIARIQQATDDLMAHWQRVLPLPIHPVRYEALVNDPEREISALCGALDLPFDRACLNFHENPRSVATGSYAQVRQPLFRDGIGRWRRYARHLAPLLDELPESEILSHVV